MATSDDYHPCYVIYPDGATHRATVRAKLMPIEDARDALMRGRQAWVAEDDASQVVAWWNDHRARHV